MIVSFFNRGTGGGSGPVDYLLGKDRSVNMRSYSRAIPMKQRPSSIQVNIQKYTAGVLSFEEKNTESTQRAR